MPQIFCFWHRCVIALPASACSETSAVCTVELFGFRRRHFLAILRWAGHCLILRWQDSKWGQTRHRHNDTLPMPCLAPFARRLLHLEVVWFVASSITRQDMSMAYLAHLLDNVMELFRCWLVFWHFSNFHWQRWQDCRVEKPPCKWI